MILRIPQKQSPGKKSIYDCSYQSKTLSRNVDEYRVKCRINDLIPHHEDIIRIVSIKIIEAQNGIETKTFENDSLMENENNLNLSEIQMDIASQDV